MRSSPRPCRKTHMASPSAPTRGDRTFGAGVALLAGAKVFLILHFFMGLRMAPRIWQWLLGLWLSMTTGLMLARQ
ncbi:MAG: cytochrome C oxidase subunit IV family protein, partial [Caldimonas sp.]